MTCWGDELAELLRRAGLEVVGDGHGENVPRTRSAWRWTGSPEARTVVAVRADRPGLSAEVDAQWHRLAVELGLMGADGEFLIDVGGEWTCCPPRRWTRVRLTPDWSFAALLGDRAATEFVTLASDGDALLGVTTEESEVRLVTVSGVRERQEAAAQAQARETPQERAAAWASLLQGADPSTGVREAWAHGLALNPATPDDLRGDLLGLSHHLLWRRLPSAVVEAAIVHPDWKVRQLLAEAQPGLTADQWSRLILGEENSRRRWILAMIAADRRDVLDEAVQQQLAADGSAQVREEAARLTGLPARILTALAADPEPAVRAEACRAAWPHLDEPARRLLLTDPDSKVRATALLRHHQDHPLSRSVFDAEGLTDDALGSCRLERDLAEHLARHGSEAQRGSLAGNPFMDPDLVALLAQDLDERVRDVVARRPDLTEEQRAAIPITFDPGTHHRSLDWVEALHHDPAAMRRLAASAHPLVRRSVARARRLPPDVIDRLARDEDRVVQLFLAESCDDAPADMLLRVWQWWTGSLTAPDRPRGHPNFPRTGLLHYADDPDPRMRRLAPDDPESTPELVERLSRDSSEEVRHRAASDPRLTAASAIRLLDDPRDSVRHAAARHPRLPARVLVRLLGDRDTAQDAARHPALPVAVIRQMIEHLRG
ncbi:PE-PGRS family protein [Streptomyces sp. NBC_01283]|uniref:PE-PGRS family protein n=1 Tax=Streptomyces sp. NBC_01283 TaxID=2903812 RepID=UPI00352D6108|nr:PE-PGRS family protein [Streptomyces sp. NBC_01283]